MDTDKLSEREKMGRGLAYNPIDDMELVRERLKARHYTKKYNDYPPPDPSTPGLTPRDFFGPDERFQILADLFKIPLEKAKLLAIEPPFHCDHGWFIEFKGEFYSNFNLVILGEKARLLKVVTLRALAMLDCAKVTIGNRVLCGPNVQMYAATHSVDVTERRAGLERAYPITIGDDVWIGGNVAIVGPCTIGNNVTVAAGAVVKGDFPDNVVIGGVPAKILKHLEPPPDITAKEASADNFPRASVP